MDEPRHRPRPNVENLSVCRFVWSIGSDDPRIPELLSNRQRIPTDESRLNVLKHEDGRVDRDRLLEREYQVDVGPFVANASSFLREKDRVYKP